MKKFLNDDLSVNELKSFFCKMKKRENLKFIIMLVIGGIALAGGIAFIVSKLINKDNCCCCDDDDEDYDCDCDHADCDENGCCYTDDEDFQ